VMTFRNHHEIKPIDMSSFRTGSVGVLIPNSECKLLNDAGSEVDDGEPGEILYRGPNTCLGYWKNEAATRDAFTADGWLKTGDIAVRKDGWFWIVDRKKVALPPSITTGLEH
jgi:4-coumarate--CoA ligase